MNHLPPISIRLLILSWMAVSLFAGLSAPAQTRSPQPEKQTTTPEPQRVVLPDGTVLPPGYLHAYAYFIDQLGMEDEDAKVRIQEGKQPRPRSDDSKGLYIEPEEDEALHRILLDAYYKIKANDAEAAKMNGEIQKSRNPEPELIAKREALNKARPQILLDALFELRRELSEDAMKRLDADIYCRNPLPSPEQERLYPNLAKENGSANCAQKMQQ